MTHAANRRRAQPWLDGLGDWGWPGRMAEALPSPPSWVPAMPPPLEPALAGAGASAGAISRREGRRRLLIAFLLSLLALVCVLLLLRGPLGIAPALQGGSAVAPAATAQEPPLPTLALVSSDAAGSSIEHTSFNSAALSGEGSFYVYLPPGFASTSAHYPVIYLLHGQNGHADGFLEIGVQETLDRLIAAHRIPPMIAVMVQDAPTMENWRDMGRRHSASYVVEVQELVDRMLPTLASRPGRAIAGGSMGGFGAMHVALANPERFSVVESWLGYFNPLGPELKADVPVIRRLGLQAFVYGAAEDPVALPYEDPEWAGRLRAAGADAEWAIYPGGHNLQKMGEHLEESFTFVGRALERAQRRALTEAIGARTALAAGR